MTVDGIEEYKHDADGGAACHLLFKYKRNIVIRGLLRLTFVSFQTMHPGFRMRQISPTYHLSLAMIL